MTNEEKIQELLNEPCWESKPYLIGMDKIGVEDVMERFAEWKDEQHAQEKQQWIERAAKWFSYRFPNMSKEVLEKFKEDMKGV